MYQATRIFASNLNAQMAQRSVRVYGTLLSNFKTILMVCGGFQQVKQYFPVLPVVTETNVGLGY